MLSGQCYVNSRFSSCPTWRAWLWHSVVSLCVCLPVVVNENGMSYQHRGRYRGNLWQDGHYAVTLAGVKRSRLELLERGVEM